MEKPKAEGKTHFNLMLEPNISDKVEKKAMEMGMPKTQYIIHCIENQPAIPTITYQTDDLSDILDILSDVKRSLEGLTDGLVLTGSVTERDIQRLLEMNQQMNEQYLCLVQKFDKQRNQAAKTARRLVREWKQSEQKAKKEAP